MVFAAFITKHAHKAISSNRVNVYCGSSGYKYSETIRCFLRKRHKKLKAARFAALRAGLRRKEEFSSALLRHAEAVP
jgi:hypothetical protein